MWTFDESLFLALNELLNGELSTPVFMAITHLGDGLVLALLILPALLWRDRIGFRKHALPLVLSVAASGLLITIMKVGFDRPRPEEHFSKHGSNVAFTLPDGSPSDRSFPSGHTQTAFGAATYLSCLYPPWSPVFLALAALVGLSRISVGVHFPLDVLVGAFIGAAFSLAGYRWALRRTGGSPRDGARSLRGDRSSTP